MDTINQVLVSPSAYTEGAFELLVAFNGTQEEIRARVRHIYLQFVVSWVITMLFLSCANISLRALLRNPSSIPAWCVFIQTLTGVVYGVVFTSRYLMPNGPSCSEYVTIA